MNMQEDGPLVTSAQPRIGEAMIDNGWMGACVTHFELCFKSFFDF